MHARGMGALGRRWCPRMLLSPFSHPIHKLGISPAQCTVMFGALNRPQIPLPSPPGLARPIRNQLLEACSGLSELPSISRIPGCMHRLEYYFYSSSHSALAVVIVPGVKRLSPTPLQPKPLSPLVSTVHFPRRYFPISGALDVELRTERRCVLNSAQMMQRRCQAHLL
jgi:hypothetical protein